MTSNPKVQLGTTTLARQCKISSYNEFFAESPGAADEPPTEGSSNEDSSTEDSSTEDSSTDESEDDEDREFVVQDESSGSEEEYVPHENSSEDDYGSVSSNSDVHYALSDGSDDEYDLGDIYVGICSDIDDTSAGREKPRYTAKSDDPLQSLSSDGPVASGTP
jgi:hypothetical protein